MARVDRIYQIERLLKQNRAVSFRRMQEELEVSRATLKRDLEHLRSRLNAPIVWDRAARGYRLESPYSLPGPYLNASEISALLVLQHLVSRTQPALLEPHMASLRGLLLRIMGHADHSSEELTRRIRILHMASRPVEAEQFQAVSAALLSRRRLDMVYYSRTSNVQTRRQVSPQRLVYYRDNWYMDAWCHLRDALRSFSLDAIREARASEDQALDIPGERLDRELGTGYGIFSGVAVNIAVLRFSPEVARWVGREKWHSEQTGRYEGDGAYVMELPYADDRELMMDILRYGPGVEVIGPAALRRKVAAALRTALDQYENVPSPSIPPELAHPVSH
jgi:predicted DNA-binding transcriptional regulator YafY